MPDVAGVMKQRCLRFAIAVGAAAFVGAVLTLELYFNTRATMERVDLGDLAIPQFGRAAMWALLAPLILQMRTRLPLERGRWIGGVSFHFAASFVVMATYYLGRMWSYSLLDEKAWDEGFWAAAQRNFYGRNIVDMVYYWAVISAGYGIEWHQRYRNEELKAAQLEAQLMETELKALRQQLHPHFLFNTLNTISVLVREGRQESAVTLIARLSALLRRSLDLTGVPEITLQQELEFLTHYLEIQQARFSDRLAVEWDIDSEARQARIPNLLLQPIVENAILHGVARKAGAGRVRIAARIGGGQLHLEVADDGPGLPAEGPRAKEGVGLRNTRDRLAKLYGPRAQLSLQSRDGAGVTVRIVLPHRP